MSNQITVTQALNSPDAKSKFQELLGKRSTQFITSVLSTVNNNKLLQNAEWPTIYQAAITAATLDLPINPNLGFAYIVPYGREAQFQMGYKGFIQLAQRSGKFKTINVSDVREGEIEDFDRLTGQIKFNWIQDNATRLKKPVVGYVSYFELLNGFSKLMYMTVEELNAHGQSYSKSFNSKNRDGKFVGLWKTNFESMAQKTVVKLLLSKYAPLSTQMEVALTTDQAVIKEDSVSFVDNSKQTVDVDSAPKKSELQLFIEEEVETLEALESVASKLTTDEELSAYNEKMNLLSKTSDKNEDKKTSKDV